MSRREFTPATKRAAFERANGTCECHRVPWLNRPNGCGVTLVTGQIFYEHVIPDRIRPDNSLDNCAALTTTCFREKTDSYDLPVIAKSNRVQDRARNIKPQHHRPIIGTKRSGWKKHMNGGWERRHGKSA